MKINLNQIATVVLTKEGADRLNEINLRYLNPALFHSLKTDYKEGDIYKAQLWSLFQDFGSMISLGSKVPFACCEIELKDDC